MDQSFYYTFKETNISTAVRKKKLLCQIFEKKNKTNKIGSDNAFKQKNQKP